MHLSVDGVVLRAYDHGKNSKLLTLLTRQQGKLTVVARGAKSLKSALFGSSNPFTYAEFILFKNNETYFVDSADTQEIFFELRNDIVNLSAAQYFLEVCYHLARENQPEEELLRVLLNSLYALSKLQTEAPFAKAVFETKVVEISGFMPDIAACALCEAQEAGYVDLTQGKITCINCAQKPPAGSVFIDKATQNALIHIYLSPIEKMFSFKITGQSKEIFQSFAEKYLIAQTDLRLPTLDFYKSLL